MKHRFTLLAFAAGLAVTAAAQSPFTFGTKSETVKNGLLSRSANQRFMKGEAVKQMPAVRTVAGKKAVARVLEAPELPTSSYGEAVEILYEDFAKMATGSIEKPDLKTDINYQMGEYEYPWWNMKPEYSTVPLWGSHYVYPAGGCAFMNGKNQEGAQLNTALVDASGNCGIVTIQFKARTLEGTASSLIVEAAETNNMGPTWNMGTAVNFPEITSEWRTYEATFYNMGPTTLFNMVIFPKEQIYIDDVLVYQIDQYVDTPVLKPHTDYTGKSFVANWEAVEGAEYYYINVYSYDSNGQVQDLLVDAKAETNSFTVENIVSGQTYYYSVRSVKGEHESMESTPIEVFDLEAPVLEPVSGIVDEKFTASWNAVPTGERYNYWVYAERKAEQDGLFYVTNEDFTGITDANGNRTGLTVDNPSYQCYSEFFMKETRQAGWRGKNCMPYDDYVCVDGWQYFNGQGDAGILSPQMDFSKDGGKINVSVKLYGDIEIMYDQDGNQVPCQTQCAVALFNFNEAKGDYDQAELVYIREVTPSWGNYSVTLTKGSPKSTIGIYAVSAPGNLYIDDVKITQDYKEGDVLREPILFKHWYDGTSIEVTLPGGLKDTPIFHKVNATKNQTAATQWTEATYKESRYSDLVCVAENITGIGSVSLNEEASVKVVENALVVNNPAGAQVAVYTADGAQVFADNSGKTYLAVNVKNDGLYIVKVGDKVVKIIK